jgi:hypothetical protein
MPDETVATGDTGDEAAQVVEQEASPANADTDQDGLIFGKYKDLDEASKGFTELNQRFGKQSQELGELRKTVETLQSQAQLAERLDRIAEHTKPKEEPPQDFDSFVDGLAEKKGWDETTTDLFREQLRASGMWTSDIQKQTEERLTKLDRAVSEKIARLEAEQLKLTPDYQAHADLIEQFVEGGMQRNAAIAMAKTLAPKLAPTQPDRMQPPASISASRTGPDTKTASYLTDEEKAQWKAEGFTDEQIAQAEENHRRNLAEAQKEGN